MNAFFTDSVTWIIVCAVLAAGGWSAFSAKKQRALAKKQEEQAKKQERLTVVGILVTVVTAIAAILVASQCGSP